LNLFIWSKNKLLRVVREQRASIISRGVRYRISICCESLAESDRWIVGSEWKYRTRKRIANWSAEIESNRNLKISKSRKPKNWRSGAADAYKRTDGYAVVDVVTPSTHTQIRPHTAALRQALSQSHTNTHTHSQQRTRIRRLAVRIFVSWWTHSHAHTF